MSFLNLIILILIVACITILFKKYAPEYSMFINIFLGISVVFYLFSNFIDVFNEIKRIAFLAKASEIHIKILFKSLGICFIAQFAADCCKDAGENFLASKIESVGKFAMISVSLPLFKEIIQIALRFMGER